MHVKDRSCNSLEGHQVYPKRTLQLRYFPVNIPNLLGTAFYKTTPVAAFELRFSIREELKKESYWRDLFPSL